MPPKSKAAAAAASAAPRVLYWFRTDLRLHDSPALHAALDLKPAAFFPVWCWDPNYVYKHRVGVNRFRFLLESMSDLSRSLTALESRTSLLVVRGDPADLLPELARRWGVTHVVFEADPTGYAARRDAEVKTRLEKIGGVEVVQKNGHWLYDPREVVEKHGGKPITSMSQFQKAASSLPAPPAPFAAPTSLPLPVLEADAASPPSTLAGVLRALAASLEGLPSYAERPGPPDVDLNSREQMGGERTQHVDCYDKVHRAEAAEGEKGKGEKKKEDEAPPVADNIFAVPTLASLGMDPASAGVLPEAAVPGGEREALRRLSALTQNSAYLATFAKPKTSPSVDHVEPSTTLLSPYIKFGCVGVRRLLADVKEAIKAYKGGSKTGVPENFEGQILFREMYAACEVAVGPQTFGRIRENKVSRYMDWYLPTQYDSSGAVIEPRPRGDAVSEERLARYKAGQTGFPWIDAAMRCLRQTGWIHHLARHSVAAFLTRGQCWISWERGAEIFEEFLLDWDPSSNAGNWMWLSCSAFFAQYFRVYGLATFPAKYDKHAFLVRKYCPELKDYPDKYIYEPWKAPKDVQKKAGCIIGEDYPMPMLDEKETKAQCLERCKAAYAAGYHGTDAKVLDGSAEKELRKKHGQPDPTHEKGSAPSDKMKAQWAKMGFSMQPAEQASPAKRKAEDGGKDEKKSAKKGKK